MQAGKRVLIVDDDRVLRRLLQVGLEKAGYQTLLAANGREAIALLDRESVDLILVDLMMPMMDGLSFLRWLRAETSISALAMVFSSFEGKTMAETALKAGASDYLSKPVNLPILLGRVERLLGVKT